MTTANHPGMDVQVLGQWIADRLPGSEETFSAERLGTTTGISNELYLLRRGQHSWVLRRPPSVKIDASASNTVREWRILKALDGTAVPHPEPLLLCEDSSVIGAPFMVMSTVDGFTPGWELPEPFASDLSLRRDLAMAYVDGCADLAEVDWAARGLDDLGKPQGFLERQVPRWMSQLSRYQTRELPHLEFLTQWLTDHTPAMSKPGIIHGDYSPFNVMVSPSPPARLAAVVDWDTGTIGDPLLDLGHLLARWTEPGEDSVVKDQAGGVEGYPTRSDMAERYANRTGRDLSALAYYEVLALFKLAILLEGAHAREVAGGTSPDETSMALPVPKILAGAVEFAVGDRV